MWVWAVMGRGCGWLGVEGVGGLVYREEEDARHGGGDGALEHADRELGDLLGGRLGALEAVLDHVGLEHLVDVGVRVRVRVRLRVRVRVRFRVRGRVA